MQIQDTTDLGYQILNHAQMGQMGPRKQMELVLSYAIFFLKQLDTISNMV